MINFKNGRSTDGEIIGNTASGSIVMAIPNMSIAEAAALSEDTAALEEIKCRDAVITGFTQCINIRKVGKNVMIRLIKGDNR